MRTSRYLIIITFLFASTAYGQQLLIFNMFCGCHDGNSHRQIDVETNDTVGMIKKKALVAFWNIGDGENSRFLEQLDSYVIVIEEEIGFCKPIRDSESVSVLLEARDKHHSIPEIVPVCKLIEVGEGLYSLPSYGV